MALDPRDWWHVPAFAAVSWLQQPANGGSAAKKPALRAGDKVGGPAINKIATFTGNQDKVQARGTAPGDAAADAAAAAAAQQAAAQAAANAAARSQSRRQNEMTRNLADLQFKLLGSFASSRDTKLSNLQRALESSDRILRDGYSNTLGSLQGNARDNDNAESDNSFRNVANALRERNDIMAEAANQGAGESDIINAQLMALRNYSNNQSEVNRSFFDTLRSVNNAITSLNTDTVTSRNNLFNQAESDRESAWANYYNQVTDTWTQIGNIENSNSNIDSDSSVGYQRAYGQAANEAAAAAASSYQRQAAPAGWDEWEGKGSKEERALNSNNRAAMVNLGGPRKRPEGANLRKW